MYSENSLFIEKDKEDLEKERFKVVKAIKQYNLGAEDDAAQEELYNKSHEAQ